MGHCCDMNQIKYAINSKNIQLFEYCISAMFQGSVSMGNPWCESRISPIIGHILDSKISNTTRIRYLEILKKYECFLDIDEYTNVVRDSDVMNSYVEWLSKCGITYEGLQS